MNTDADELTKKRKVTASIVCIAAAVFVLIPCLGLRWMKGVNVDAGVSLLFIEAGDESISNLDAIEQANAAVERFNERIDDARAMGYGDDAPSKRETILGTFAYAGIATIFFSIISAGALIAAGVLSLRKDKFIRSPVALTSVALIGLLLALVLGCVFLGSIPKDMGFKAGVSWPFFMFGTGVVAGLAGAQMLAKAYREVSDPYWDGQV